MGVESEARVTDNRTGLTIRVPRGRTVLEAALDANLDMEHGCTVGVCGACAVEVLEGEETADAPDPIEEDSLARFQLGPGRRLACRMTCRGPMTLGPVDDEE